MINIVNIINKVQNATKNFVCFHEYKSLGQHRRKYYNRCNKCGIYEVFDISNGKSYRTPILDKEILKSLKRGI